MKKGTKPQTRKKVTYKGQTFLLQPGHSVYGLNLLTGNVFLADLVPIRQKKQKSFLGIKYGPLIEFGEVVGYGLNENQQFEYVPAINIFRARQYFRRAFKEIVKKNGFYIH